MKKRILPVLILIFCVGIHLQAQDLEEKTKSIEIGLNITNTLSGFLNSGGQITPLDPYLLSFKKINNHQGLRLGLNFSARNVDELGGFTNGFQRKVNETAINLRLGYEKRIPISPRFTFFWGIDGVFQYDTETVRFFTGNGNLDLKERSTGFGGGPIMGILWHLHPRVYLSTESYIYAVYNVGKEVEFLDQTGSATSTKEIRGFEFIPVYPNALYITFSF